MQWPVGLTSMGSAYGKLYPNSPNGTTANYLACIDATITTVAEVTTCGTSTTKAIGVVHLGTAGVTGNAQVTMLGFDSCVFDNQTVVGDYVGPSTSVAGQCTDLGSTRPSSFQGVGRVNTLNNGAATAAIIDLGPWDLFAPGSTGAGQCAFNNVNAYFTGGNLVCDQFVTDDGAGNMTMKSLGLTDATKAGFFYIKQGAQPAATPANTIMEYAPTAVTTYSMQKPAAAGSASQCYQVISTTTDSSGNPIDVMGFGACGGGTTAPQITTPSAPVLTTNGSAGSTTYKYKVVACQDGPPCAYHTAASAEATIATGNATLTSSNSINLKTFADTLYGPRCYNIYRTSSAGTPSSTGLIANCVWKSFIDTGVAGDSTTAPSTNTTVLDANGLTNPLPGCNKTPAAPWGIDGPPCTPKKEDDEYTWGNGSWVPGDTNNPFWTQTNWGTSVATLTNGELKIAPQVGNGAHAFRLLTQPVPGSTPWEFEGVVLPLHGNQSLGQEFGICLYDGTKFYLFGTDLNTLTIVVYRWTNFTTFSATAFQNANYNTGDTWMYLKVKDDATNYTFSWSFDGVNFASFAEPVGTFLAAPTAIGPCIDTNQNTAASTAPATETVDFFRRTQ